MPSNLCPQKRHKITWQMKYFCWKEEKGDDSGASQQWILEMERKALWSIRTKYFLLYSKESQALQDAGSHFPNFPGSFPYFFPEKSSFSHGFQSGLHSPGCLLPLNNKPCGIEERSLKWGWTVAWVLLHMHSDPPQWILPKDRQEGSGEGEVMQAE